MGTRKADAGNWQARGQEFEVGQTVRLTSNGAETEGRVSAVWPGIGMVDVQWPHTSNRHPVEELQIVNPGEDMFLAPVHETVPGGAGSAADVSEGALQENYVADVDERIEMVHEVGDLPKEDDEDEDEDGVPKLARVVPSRKMALRVASAFVKKSLYWHARDRKYRVSRDEHSSGAYICPNRGCGGTMRRATYKMEDGCKVKLHVCPSCLFMIRAADVLDDHCVAPEGVV